MRKIVLFLLFGILAMPLTAQTDSLCVLPADTLLADTLSVDTLPYPQNIRQRLDTLIAKSSMLKTSQLGLMVYDLTADSVVYRHNERQTMRPASTQKLVTAIAAIDRLGGSYQLRTSLYYTGRINNHTLEGDLVCVGGMDPAFGHDDLTSFVESLRRLGVDTISGSIVADRSMKDADLLGEGWCWDDDNPVLSPLLISRKDNFAERLLQALGDDGVVMADSTRRAASTSGRTLVCTRTHTIDQILSKMMKDSDNLYAESMFYQLAASSGSRPAKASHGRSLVNQLIQRVGLQPGNYKIADGSGLSLYNYLTPELHVRLLRYAYRNPNVFEHLLPSLPIAGEDGTLKNRMKGTAAAGNVRAKTGTVTCVSCLAGYCTAANGHDLCFAIMNQGVLRISEGRTFQDRVCRALCEPAHTSLKTILAAPAPQVKKPTKQVRKPAASQRSVKRKTAAKRRRR